MPSRRARLNALSCRSVPRVRFSPSTKSACLLVSAQIMHAFSVAPFDQNLSLDGKILSDDTATLGSLGVIPESVILLKVTGGRGCRNRGGSAEDGAGFSCSSLSEEQNPLFFFILRSIFFSWPKILVNPVPGRCLGCSLLPSGSSPAR